MISIKYVFLIFSVILFFQTCLPPYDLYQIPNTDPATKPWTRWWWMGNSVTREGITQHLEAFSKKGIGGVEIVPIYGERGDEKNFISYLSDQWINMLIHTLAEAERLNMEVDMTLGSGWPYGGPWIEEKFAARKYIPGHMEGLPTNQRVKRAAPGAEGLVVDHFNVEAMHFFLQRFDSLIRVIKQRNMPLRAVFNDSYEVYGANWTSNFLTEFRNRMGYDLLFEFPDIFDSLRSKKPISGWSDYHQTIHELLYETTGTTIKEWCESLDVLYRYQAHGSPANLLDMYAAADIPETESFGPSQFKIPGVRYDYDFDVERFSKPDPLIMKFASSPAHILQKKLVSSETGTWLGNHFKVSLSQFKPQVDELFVAGINHIFYHGIPYSPFEKPFPGRLFYASTNFGPSSALWPYLDEMNEYITICQSILQNTAPDNDILVYFPVYDLWQRRGSSDLILMHDIHNPDNWLYRSSLGETSRELWENGYSFDYISDLQLHMINEGSLKISKSYKLLVIPKTNIMPIRTLENILSLSKKNLQVIFIDEFPAEVPGHYQRDIRLDSLRKIITETEHLSAEKVNHNNLFSTLRKERIRKLDFETDGIYYIRKKHLKGWIYFITNLGSNEYDNLLKITENIKSAEIFNPTQKKRGIAEITRKDNSTHVKLQLQPGESVFLITYQHPIKGKNWDYFVSSDKIINLNTGWEIQFADSLKIQTDSLFSWTDLPFGWAPLYSGNAKYHLKFNINQRIDQYSRFRLDLGDVREMATVNINHQNIAKTWHVPYQIDFSSSLLKKENTIDILVTNLDANRIIKMEQDGIPWKNFYDINFVDITYNVFDATDWDPLPSGLLGPVKLIPIDKKISRP